MPAGELGIEEFQAAGDGQAAARRTASSAAGTVAGAPRCQVPDSAGQPLLGEFLSGYVAAAGLAPAAVAGVRARPWSFGRGAHLMTVCQPGLFAHCRIGSAVVNPR